MGMLKNKRIGREILLAGQQRRWQTSSGLGDSNSATEGELGHVRSFWLEMRLAGEESRELYFSSTSAIGQETIIQTSLKLQKLGAEPLPYLKPLSHKPLTASQA